MLFSLARLIHRWLLKQVDKPAHDELFDFEKILAGTKPADVWLVEGHTRLSRIISVITRSPWTHAMLFIGKPKQTLSPEDCQKISKHYVGSLDEPLVIESRMGRGVIINPAVHYQNRHIRICRAKGLVAADVEKVIRYAIAHLGDGYNSLQILDLARFLYPWHILPRRWHSSLFTFKAGETTKLTCSCLLANAFESVDFPILPLILKSKKEHPVFVLRNPNLFTPRDFDYSPFFEILKFPVVEFSKTHNYRNLEWDLAVYGNDDGSLIKRLDNTTTIR